MMKDLLKDEAFDFVNSKDKEFIAAFDAVMNREEWSGYWRGENREKYAKALDNSHRGNCLYCKTKATKSEMQYFETSTTMFDPEGHLSCFSTMKQ